MKSFKEHAVSLGLGETRIRLAIGAVLALILGLALVISAVNDRIGRLVKKRGAREAEVAEMLILKQRYLEAKISSQRTANRLTTVRPDDSPARIFEQIGIRGKNSQIKQVKGEEKSGYVEDAAELRIEGLTGNEMVNLIYRLEKGAKPVVIKKASVRTRFDDPARLDLTLTVALLKAPPQGGK